jgi:hypothetical protein
MERSLSNLEVVEECVLDNSVETWFHFTLIPHTVRCCIVCFEIQLGFHTAVHARSIVFRNECVSRF